MIKFDVKNRYSSEVQFTAEIDCHNNTPKSIKLGLAVKWGIKNKQNLNEADFSGADLSGADLSGANFFRASFSGADLSGADLSGASLIEANLSRANLIEADLSGAELFRASLFKANLSGAELFRASLSGAVGIISFGPVGEHGRIGIAYLQEDNKTYVNLGCFNGTKKEAIQALNKKYGARSSYAAVIRACCKELEEKLND